MKQLKDTLPYVIRDNLVIDRQSGAYRDSVETDGLKRFTAWVRYVMVDGEYVPPLQDLGGSLPEGSLESWEEIDVDARTAGDAHELATRVLEADYEPGGHVVRVEERFGWYM